MVLNQRHQDATGRMYDCQIRSTLGSQQNASGEVVGVRIFLRLPASPIDIHLLVLGRKSIAGSSVQM